MNLVPIPSKHFWANSDAKFRQLDKAVAVRSALLERFSGNFLLSLPRFGHFPARRTAAGKLAAPSGTLLDFLPRDRHSLLEFFRKIKIPPHTPQKLSEGPPQDRPATATVFLYLLSALEIQQRYFSYRAILVAIVSQNDFVLVF